MPIRYFGFSACLCTVLLLVGCVGQEKRPYYACHYGQSLEQKCLETEVAEDRKLVCVDLTRKVRFEPQDCDKQVKEKKYLMF